MVMAGPASKMLKALCLLILLQGVNCLVNHVPFAASTGRVASAAKASCATAWKSPLILGRGHVLNAAHLRRMACRKSREVPTRMVADPSQLVDMSNLTGIGLGFPVGFVLGLLGGGGSILALPIFLYALNEPTQSAIAESLVVVSIGAGVGFLTKVKAGVNLDIALPFAGLAMTGSFFTAKYATVVPEAIRLGMFTMFALTSSISMWESAQDKPKAAEPQAMPQVRVAMEVGEGDPQKKGFSPQLGAQALGVGALTSMIGAGGGFVIMPALTLVGGIPVKQAVSSSLLIICLNSASAFASYVSEVPLHWNIVLPFSATVAAGAIAGSMCSDKVDGNMVKKLFSGTVLALCAGLLAWKLPGAIMNLH